MQARLFLHLLDGAASMFEKVAKGQAKTTSSFLLPSPLQVENSGSCPFSDTD